MRIGKIEAIRQYPVKSLRGDVLQTVGVEESGIAGDRAEALFAASGARAGKTYRGKENHRLHLLSTAADASADAARRGVEVELRRGEHFFDDAPISLIFDRWLEPLDAHLGYAVEWERFRPNFFVRAARDFAQPEEALNGSELSVGGVRLRVRGPIERCVTITYDPNGAPSDPHILRFLAQHRNAWLGIYCDVLATGNVSLGDEVTLCR